MNEKKQNEIKDEKIEGQIDIDNAVELKIVEETADTLVAEMPDGEVVEIDKDSIIAEVDLVDQREERELPDGVYVCSCGDHIEKSKVIEIIKNTMVKYEGKVVLAMSEVRDIIKAITNAVNE